MKMVTWTLIYATLLVVLTEPATPKCVETPRGLIEHFWTGDTDASDIVGGNDGMLEGATVGEEGMVSGACGFNPGDRVDLSKTITLEGDFTAMAWWKTSSAGRHTLFGHGDNVGRDYLQIRNQWRYKYLIDGASGNDGYNAYVDYALNTWNHVAMVRRKGFVTVYHNGIKLDPVSEPLYGPFHIGNIGRCDDNWNAMSGQIDEVLIYRRALNQNHIKEIYEAASEGVCIDPTK